MFQRVRYSWEKGALSDNIARWLIVAQLGLTAAISIIVLVRIEVFDGALPLRFATSEGYYDEGGWYRPLLIILFALLVSVTTTVVSSSLFTQKDRELARGVLVCSLILLLIAVQLAINFIIPGQV